MRDIIVPTFVLDATGRVIIWNNALAKLTGVTADEVTGTANHWRGFYRDKRPCAADLLIAGDEHFEELYEDVVSYSQSDRRISVENWCHFPKAKEPRYLAIDAGPIYSEYGDLIAVVETLRDITDQKNAETELLRLASVDGLTGIANRRSFDQFIEDHWQSATVQHKELSLLLVDIDNFKKYNDRYGHQAGDDCIRNISNLIAETLKYSDGQVARYGGEEFVVILPSTDKDSAWGVAERIRASLQYHPAQVDAELNISMTVSIGITEFRHDGSDSRISLFERADRALYTAKHSGRNRVVYGD